VHPTRFGKYEVIEEIARGAFGIVLRARDSEIGRDVAIKVMREEEADDDGVVERFVRESRLAARLSHPHIVRVIEAGVLGGVPYFVMELVEGLPLAAVIYTSDLSVGDAARLFGSIARAVHFAHERGVIHRDLKPGNILVRHDGEPVVMDFGIAHDSLRRTALTRAGELLGTPQYMAPEQIAGGRVDPRADVYALGAVLYEFMTKRTPFEASGFAELSMRILNDEPVPPHHVNPMADAALETICLKCLRKKPEERYASARAMAEDLSHVGRLEPAVVAPRRQRHVAWMGLVGALLAAVLAAAAPPRAPGRLIETTPSGASIYIDGRFAGVAPLYVDAAWVTARLPGRPDVHSPAGAISLPIMSPDGMAVVASLLVDAHEVSQAQYAAFVEATGARAPWKSQAKSRLAEPVTGVTWDEATAYASWAGKRLPTVAEWQAIASCPALGLAGGVQEWAIDERGVYRALCGGSAAMEEHGREVVIWRSGASRLPDAGFRCVRDR